MAQAITGMKKKIVKHFEVEESPNVKNYNSKKEKLRLRDAELIRGIFHFLEVPGGSLTFPYRKYAGPIKSYTLVDGEEYKLPRGVARHLANTGSYPVHEHSIDEFGKPSIRIGRKKKRYSFEALGFFDDEIGDHEESKIFTVERI